MSAFVYLTPMGYSVVSRTHWTVRPVMVVVAAMRSTMTWWLIKGRPRQFMVICENSLCSILFHLLVPGGTGPRQSPGGGVSVAYQLVSSSVSGCLMSRA